MDVYKAPWEREGKINHPWYNMHDDFAELCDDIYAWAVHWGYDVICANNTLTVLWGEQKEGNGPLSGTQADERMEWFLLLGRIGNHPDGDLEFHYPHVVNTDIHPTKAVVFHMWHD